MNTHEHLVNSKNRMSDGDGSMIFPYIPNQWHRGERPTKMDVLKEGIYLSINQVQSGDPIFFHFYDDIRFGISINNDRELSFNLTYLPISLSAEKLKIILDLIVEAIPMLTKPFVTNQ